MNKLNKCLCVFYVACHHIGAACAFENTNAVLVQLRASPDHIYPCEPVVLACVMQNTSVFDKEADAAMGDFIAIRREGSSNWETFTPYDFSPPPLAKPKRIVIRAGQTETSSRIILASFNGEPAFAVPGIFMVKMATPFGDSNAIRLIVDQVPESDEAALKIVVRQQLFLWFGLDERASYYAHHGDTAKSDEARTNLADLARSHPSSRYARWAAYGVMWNEKNRILKSIEKHESTLASAAGALRAIQTEMERQAPNCPDHVRNFCLYGAAIIHLQLGEQERAKSDFEKLSGSAASDFFSNRISNAQSTIFRKDDAP